MDGIRREQEVDLKALVDSKRDEIDSILFGRCQRMRGKK
jgi:hypothetical protein